MSEIEANNTNLLYLKNIVVRYTYYFNKYNIHIFRKDNISQRLDYYWRIVAFANIIN